MSAGAPFYTHPQNSAKLSEFRQTTVRHPKWRNRCFDSTYWHSVKVLILRDLRPRHVHSQNIHLKRVNMYYRVCTCAYNRRSIPSTSSS